MQLLSELLRAFPHHSLVARKASFRNPDGVAFKLQNLRKVGTDKGLGHVSKMDREVWGEFGENPTQTKEMADLIRKGIELVQELEAQPSEDEEYIEGRIVTETHLRRERNPKLRKKLLEQRIGRGGLICDICSCVPSSPIAECAEAMFEAHHILPLAASTERKTKLEDMALLCANCHRMIHRAIALQKRWIKIDDARELLLQKTS